MRGGVVAVLAVLSGAVGGVGEGEGSLWQRERELPRAEPGARARAAVGSWRGHRPRRVVVGQRALVRVRVGARVRARVGARVRVRVRVGVRAP